jgi:hypothetical protein
MVMGVWGASVSDGIHTVDTQQPFWLSDGDGGVGTIYFRWNSYSGYTQQPFWLSDGDGGVGTIYFRWNSYSGYTHSIPFGWMRTSTPRELFSTRWLSEGKQKGSTLESLGII